MKHISTVIFLLLFQALYAQERPLKLAVINLTHSHVHWVFQSEKRGDIEIVAIVEPNQEVAEKYARQYSFSKDLVYDSIEQMLRKVKPEGVAAFGSIYDHLAVVEAFAPLGIHVMVEKPLAVNMKHARKMEALADKHKIHLLTNYETTWYASNHKVYEILSSGSIGNIKKVVVRDGHRGPKNIGVPPEFFEWLTDPALNGGGALTDFGCYGANLMTWLMNGQKPLKVLAINQQLQPENNAKVEDESNVILVYQNANAILQPSWNWPIGRKDMEVYGTSGAIFANNRTHLSLRMAKGYDDYTETVYNLEERTKPHNDPFSLFKAVIRNEVKLSEYDLSSLKNNMIVTEILDAAAKSAKKGKAIILKP